MIIIDFYNFFYVRFTDVTNTNIIKAMTHIVNYAKYNKKKITVVFDGYYDTMILPKNSYVTVIFSHYNSADDYIIDIFKKLHGSLNSIVSSDRALIIKVKKMSNPTIISPRDFWKESFFTEYNEKNVITKLIKYKNENDDDESLENDPFLDDLYKKYT